VVSECYIGIDRSTVLGSGRGDGRCLSSGGTMVLEVEYIRELVSKGERERGVLFDVMTGL
jgi:hypothetical protein